jgi:PTH1 family peptidyl-tRNA hydrolase
MRYIIGLGNPGIKFEQTRHNIGFKVVEKIAQDLGFSWQEKSKLNAAVARGTASGEQFTLIKPLNFMNLSGQPVRAVIDFFQDFSIEDKQQKLEDLSVVFDDLDLEVGSTKVQFGKGPHGHNGLNSLYEHLGTTQFWHVRIGVDGRKGARNIPPDKYVLQPFEKDEQDLAKAAVVEVAQDLIE